jgi:hypothetical protein
MHTLTCWQEETPIERTERFGYWYDRYSDLEGEPKTITVHEVWDSYGGPEEGGWTYECGYPVETICIFSRSQAIRVLHELHEKYDGEDYEEKTYDINLDQGYAEFYPQIRPHYE